jgi:hypothetical protein
MAQAAQPTDADIIAALTRALVEIRDSSNRAYQVGDVAARHMLVDNYNTANTALLYVGKQK